MKWRIHLVIFVFLALGDSGFAQWNGIAKAWPATNHLRLPAPVSVSLYAINWTAVVTNWATGSNVVTTQQFLTDIRPGQQSGSYTQNFLFYIAQTNGQSVNWRPAKAIGSYVKTNLLLQARDVWALESYLAMQERWSAIQSEYLYCSTIIPGHTPVEPRFYRSNRDALVFTKQWIQAAAPYFLRPPDIFNMADNLYSNQAQIETYSDGIVSITDMLAIDGLEATWGTDTGWRSLAQEWEYVRDVLGAMMWIRSCRGWSQPAGWSSWDAYAAGYFTSVDGRRSWAETFLNYGNSGGGNPSVTYADSGFYCWSGIYVEDGGSGQYGYRSAINHPAPTNLAAKVDVYGVTAGDNEFYMDADWWPTFIPAPTGFGQFVRHTFSKSIGESSIYEEFSSKLPPAEWPPLNPPDYWDPPGTPCRFELNAGMEFQLVAIVKRWEFLYRGIPTLGIE